VSTETIVLMTVSTITLTAPLVLAGLGGLTSERAGVMNIALEGKVLASACATALVATASGSAVIGLLAGLLAAIVFSLLHFVLTQIYRIDHIISGMGINLLSIGLTSLVAKSLTDPDAVSRSPMLPIQIYWVVALLSTLGMLIYLKRTRGGLHLMAVGNSPSKSRQMGLSPLKVRLAALVATGVFCGIAGALIVTNAGSFTDNMTAGRGYIALAALILGSWRPVPMLAGCLLFGMLEALQLQLQGSTVFAATIPATVWSALPYLVTLVALAGFLGRSRPPAGLGEP